MQFVPQMVVIIDNWSLLEGGRKLKNETHFFSFSMVQSKFRKHTVRFFSQIHRDLTQICLKCQADSFFLS